MIANIPTLLPTAKRFRPGAEIVPSGNPTRKFFGIPATGSAGLVADTPVPYRRSTRFFWSGMDRQLLAGLDGIIPLFIGCSGFNRRALIAVRSVFPLRFAERGFATAIDQAIIEFISAIPSGARLSELPWSARRCVPLRNLIFLGCRFDQRRLNFYRRMSARAHGGATISPSEDAQQRAARFELLRAGRRQTIGRVRCRRRFPIVSAFFSDFA
jgi:hypothetical protein